MPQPSPSSPLRRATARVLVACAALVMAAGVSGSIAASAHAFEAGVADQKPSVWKDPRIQALKVKHARLIVPWNAATSEPGTVQAWLDATAAQGIEPHVAFEHLRTDNCPFSRCTAPTVSQFRAAVDAFIARWPQVRTYTVWNEVNHQSQPVRNRPDLVAEYYKQLTAACSGCTVVAGDVLDSGNYIGWLRSFLGNFDVPPQLWGIHNYSDAGRGVSTGTDAVLATVPGTLWMEETGGIVQLRGSLSGGGSRDAAEAQSAAAIDYAFTLARTRPRIGRLYVYHVHAWAHDTFDSGIFRPDLTTRPGYTALLRNLSNLNQTTAAAATAATVLPPRATVRWSKASGGRIVVRITCPTGSTECAGSVRVSTRTRGPKAKTWVLKTLATRSFTATKGTATLRVKLTPAARQRLRRASKRQAIARVAQVTPTVVNLTASRTLPRP